MNRYFAIKPYERLKWWVRVLWWIADGLWQIHLLNDRLIIRIYMRTDFMKRGRIREVIISILEKLMESRIEKKFDDILIIKFKKFLYRHPKIVIDYAGRFIGMSNEIF